MAEPEVHPLRTRYTGNDMQEVFSNEYKFPGWRRCWTALAESQMELGIDRIKPDYIAAMHKLLDEVPYDKADAYEKEMRHDVNAHIRAYKEQLEEICPGAGEIVHLGATSMFPCDNTELMQIREGLAIIIDKTVNAFRRMVPFARQYKNTPCTAKTHYQPAQPTTFGKRICDWMHGLSIALEHVEYESVNLKARGVKGATGTQDSYMKLYQGNSELVRELDRRVAAKLGFDKVYIITTQTYPRIVDYTVLSAIGGVSVAAKSTMTNIRLLQGEGELSEPSRISQVGSSAMAYKQNPMKSERTCGLGRHGFIGGLEAAMYASEQWLERTLDDSAERRIVIPDTFLSVDAVLNLVLDVFTPDTEKQKGFRVYEGVAARHLRENMPFFVTEGIILAETLSGGDRLDTHEKIRVCGLAARESIDAGGPNTMIEEMAKDPALREQLENLGVNFEEPKKNHEPRGALDPMNYIGRTPQQCEEFIDEVIQPVLDRHADVHEMDGGVKV